MSIASDLREYADTAVTQGKQVIDQALDQAQSQLGPVTEKATEAVQELRATAEKAVNLDALTTAIEPYLTQLKEYTSVVTDKVDGFVSVLTGDPRVAKLVETAGSVTGVVVDTVQERVLKPVQSLTGFGGKPVPAAKSAPKPTSAKAAPAKAIRKPAATKPASKPTSKPTSKPATAPAAPKAATKPATKPAPRKSSPGTTTKA